MRGTVHVIGTASTMSASQAALCDGVAGHALDFDDCGLGGHPSVPVLAAVFALADDLGATGSQVIEAAVAGYEAMAQVNSASGNSAYARGFHTTGTLGTFGAAAACGRLLRLPDVPMQRALGLAATQAAGCDPAGFTDDRVRDPQLARIRDTVRVVPMCDIARGEATKATIRLASGEALTEAVNHSVPVADDALDDQWDVLRAKFIGLSAPVIGSQAARQHTAENVADLLAPCCLPVG